MLLLRVLALDVGEKRIGVALSDPSGFLAFPLTTIKTESESRDIDVLIHLVNKYDVDEIVVGLPLLLSGRFGTQANNVVRFADNLSKLASVEVKTVDERYSTVEAGKLLRQSGIEPSRQKDRVDSAAAAILLQTYLDSRRKDK